VQKLLILFCLSRSILFSQSLPECKQRFDTYLNFKGSLNEVVKFEENTIFLLDSKGNKELAVYAEEIYPLADFFENSDYRQQSQFFKQKGLKKLSSRQRDSLLIFTDNKRDVAQFKNKKPLQGFRVAIDPGHFATTRKDAEIEQRYLYFVKDSVNRPLDTIKLFESELAFNTAEQLKVMLEGVGAEVLLTRNKNNHTSFNCSYNDWITFHKKRTLDSLKAIDQLSETRYKQILLLKPYPLFWDFFHDLDINNRAKKINQFHPHASVIIHFNVDELNNPWIKPSNKNFTMAFIGGSFTSDNLNKWEAKINFLRLLLTKQLNLSEKLSKATVKNFNVNLQIPIASANDAIYLNSNCKTTCSAGVFSRNLILCRKINSPLVYGESMYQDNFLECESLMKCDLDVYGIKTNQRLNLVAKSYYAAVYDFLKTSR